MRYASQTQSITFGRRTFRVQSVLYIALLVVGLSLLIPWNSMSISLVSAAILTTTLTSVAVWLILRQNRLQARVRHLETQIRHLQHQKSPQPLEAQSLLHVEPENFFNKEQTRH